jgi:RNA polymerase sigma-70 factor, ECF subfamily
MAERTDAILVASARRGDADALEALVRRYLRPAFLVALAVVRNVADAEDLAQEALAGALQRLEQCRTPSCFSGWLLQSVRHRALNHLERGRVRSALIDEMDRNELVEADAARVVERRRLLAALEHLSPAQRQVVLLHDLEEWTHGEIGAALGFSEVMSRQHLFLARRAMRQRLAQDSQKEADHG